MDHLFRHMPTALAMLTLLTGCSSYPPAEEPEAQPLHVRRSIETYEPSSPELTALRRGIEVMRSRELTDPTSWCYQANMHGYSADSLGMCPELSEADADLAPTYLECADGTKIETQTGMLPGWSQCQHGSYFLVSWHRMYVYYLERILRAASGDPNLTMPYWPWNDGEHRQVPLPLRQPADMDENSLYVEARSKPANLGLKLPSSAVSTTDAFATSVFANLEGGGSFGGRQGLHEQHDAINFGPLADSKGLLAVPHANIHSLTGGKGGWMSDNNLTAQDPLFWMHHSNIDRLWSQWVAQYQGNIDGNPIHDPNWMNHKFLFFDETGQHVCMSGREVVDAAAQLGYVYDDHDEASDSTLTTDSGTAAADEPASEPQVVASSDTTRVELNNGANVVQVTFDDDELQQLGQAMEQGQEVVASVNSLQFDDNPGTTCEVYINPQTTSGLQSTDDSFAGTIDFFASRGHGASYDQPVPAFSRALILDNALAKTLGPTSQIVLVMRGWQAADGVDAETEEESGVLAWFESVSLSVR